MTQGVESLKLQRLVAEYNGKHDVPVNWFYLERMAERTAEQLIEDALREDREIVYPEDPPGVLT